MPSSRCRTIVLAASLAAAPAASAQRVLLQIKPHVGDTIRMHLTQTVEMTGRMSVASGDSTKTMTTSTEIFSRAVPFQWTAGGTLIHAITDSVIAGPQGGAMPGGAMPRKVLPSAIVLRVASDGSIDAVDPASEVRNLFAEMPAVLPRKAVSVGDRWTKEMRIPLAGDPGSDGTVKAVLQLDSLSRSGEIAFISIRGTLSRLAESRRASPASYKAAGTLTGSMQIDRALGWITDARSVVTVQSEIGDSPASSSRSNRPVLVHTKVSVWIRAMRVR